MTHHRVDAELGSSSGVQAIWLCFFDSFQALESAPFARGVADEPRVRILVHRARRLTALLLTVSGAGAWEAIKSATVGFIELVSRALHRGTHVAQPPH